MPPPDDNTTPYDSATPGPHDPNATGPMDATPPGRTDLGTVIAGKYTLVELIGEGGMGSVYLARQTEPVRRDVAVKLIKAGADSRSVVARFEAERQALALMDHPHIARVYDGGTTPTGMPFFVMELVRGVPLTRYCDFHRLSVPARLELFVAVCLAVQHAHQKGIIHRDLKPGNVLVTEVDGKPVPKVIDFGVAKATEQKLTDVSFLDTGLVVGTPAYMSPEQADPGTQDIDTRTDVYALGVILYELLTGSPPIDAKQFKRGAIHEMIRMVRELDPPRPSTKLSRADALPNIAANRNLEPAQLAKLVRGELDCVVMKALEKDRTRRYDSANGFAADVQRYLAGEAVLAYPPSRAYRFKKFLRKNRGPVVAASVVFLSLVAGVVGTSLGFVRARENEKAAREFAAGESRARAAETEQRKAAERANRQALAALRSFTDELMGQLLGSKDKLSDTDRAILRNAQKQWEVFAESKGDSPEAREIRAEGAAELSIIQHKLGLTVEAEASDRAALDLRAGLAAEFPDEPRYEYAAGLSHWNLGNNLRSTGHRTEAETHYGKALAIFQSLVADFPEKLAYRQRLARSYIGMANVTRAKSEWAGAEKYYRDALTIQTKLADEHPDSEAYHLDCTNSHWGLAYTLRRAKKPAESEAEYRLALGRMKQLAADFPADSRYRQQAANLARELGIFLYDQGDEQNDRAKLEAGAALFPDALDVLNDLVAKYPSLPVYQIDALACHRDYGKVLGLLDRRIEAVEQFQKAIAHGEKLVAENPTVLPHQVDLGLCYSFYASFLQDSPTPADSLEWAGKAIRTLTAAHEQDRQVFLTRRALAKCHAGRADTLDSLGRFAEALPDREKALEIGPPEMRDGCRFDRANTRLRVGQVAEAMAEVDELSKIESKNPGHGYNLARLYAFASTKIDAKKTEYANRAMELLLKAVAAGFQDAARLVKSDDLLPLRDRDDFMKLLAGLPTK